MTLVSSQTKSKAGLMDRLSVKVTALLLGTFVFVFLILLAYSLFVSTVEQKLAESNLPAQAVVEDIDPKIEQNLSSVVESSESDEEKRPVAKDPFLDRGGISGLVKGSGGSFSPLNRFSSGRNPASSSVASAGSTPRKSTGKSNTEINRSSISSSSNGRAPVKPKELSTKDRLQIWEQRARFGDMSAPSPTIFAITDLIPVGVVDGGSGEKEVIFFSESANKTFSFPVGTRFYDGWLVNILDEGVVFSDGGKMRPVTILKSWGRGVRARGLQSVTVKTNFDKRPLNEGEPTKQGTNQAVLGGNN